MPELEIVKDNDTISLIKGGFKARTAKDSDYLDVLHAERFPKSGILPPVVRWISKSRRFILLERPPCIMTVSYHHAKQGDIKEGMKEYKFDIPLPWQLYMIALGQDYYPTHIACYATRHPIYTWEDELGLMPLPNLYRSGFLCMPPRDFVNDDVPTSVAEGISVAYRIFWQSGFNIDMTDSFTYCKSHLRPSLLFDDATKGWSARSLYTNWEKKNRDNIIGADWLQPNGWGTVADREEINVLTAAHLVNKMSELDVEGGENQPLPNLLIRLEQAFLRT